MENYRKQLKNKAVNFSELTEQNAAFSFQKQLLFGEVIGNHDWQFDMNRGVISFNEDKVYPVQIIGSLSFNDYSWLWGWANSQSGIPEHLLEHSLKLKEFGTNNKIKELSESHFFVEKDFEHKIGMIASGFFNTNCYYCANYGQGTLVVTIQSDTLPEIDKNKIESILTVFPQFITANEINHKKSFVNYLIDYELDIQEHETEVKAIKDDKIITASFDNQERLINLTGENLRP